MELFNNKAPSIENNPYFQSDAYEGYDSPTLIFAGIALIALAIIVLLSAYLYDKRLKKQEDDGVLKDGKKTTKLFNCSMILFVLLAVPGGILIAASDDAKEYTPEQQAQAVRVWADEAHGRDMSGVSDEDINGVFDHGVEDLCPDGVYECDPDLYVTLKDDEGEEFLVKIENRREGRGWISTNYKLADKDEEIRKITGYKDRKMEEITGDQ